MEMLNPEQLAIFKFQPDNIIMIHKGTKTLYEYFQIPIIALKQRHLSHTNLLQAAFLPTGILYKKGITSMHTQTSRRIKMLNKQYYQEEQLVNTFLPVLQCLQYLHSKDVIHGSVTTENIIFTQQGDVLLRDWLLQIPKNKYYQNSKLKDRNKNDDISALALILLEASALIQMGDQVRNSFNQENRLRKLSQRHSRGYILAIYVMLRRVQKFYPHLDKLLKNNEGYIESSQQLTGIYKRIKGQEQSKPIANPYLMNLSNYKYTDLISKAPLATRKTMRIQDVQNKKNFLQQTKIKNIDRVHRIAQNNFNSEMPKKPDMALKKMSNMKFNINQDSQNPYKRVIKEDVLKFSSPLKRLRTISRRKAF